MRVPIVAIGLALALTSCVPPTTPPKPQEDSVWRVEGEASSRRTARTGTGAIAERVLETGILDLGDRSASLTLVVFLHPSCRYCNQFVTEQLPLLLQQFIATGELHYETVILPLRKYPASQTLAAGLYCAAMQGKGRAMHDLLLSGQVQTDAALQSQIKPLALDANLFRTCLTDPVTIHLLDVQASIAQSLGVTLVPTFFLNGEKFVGLQHETDLLGRVRNAVAAHRATQF